MEKICANCGKYVWGISFGIQDKVSMFRDPPAFCSESCSYSFLEKRDKESLARGHSCNPHTIIYDEASTVTTEDVLKVMEALKQNTKQQGKIGGTPVTSRPPPPQDATPPEYKRSECVGCIAKLEIIRELSSELDKLHEAETAKEDRKTHTQT